MRHIASTLALLTTLACPALAQTTAAQQPAATPPAAAAQGSDTRPATTTTQGDTGLWIVPTGEVLPARRWSVSAYRVNFDDNQGFSDVSNWPVTFGVGLNDRAELFGSWVLVNRIDRDVRPLFDPNLPEAGGVVPQNPLAKSGWSGNNLGDLLGRRQVQHDVAVAAAARRVCRARDGEAADRRQGQRRRHRQDRLRLRRHPQQGSQRDRRSVRLRRIHHPRRAGRRGGDERLQMGLGAGFPTRRPLRFTAELSGEAYTHSTPRDEDGARRRRRIVLPAGFVSHVKSPLDVDLGLTWQAPNGFFAGAGWTWRVTMDSRDSFLSQFTNGRGGSDGRGRPHRLPPWRPRLRAGAAAPASAATAAPSSRTSRRRCTRAASPARWRSGRHPR